MKVPDLGTESGQSSNDKTICRIGKWHKDSGATGDDFEVCKFMEKEINKTKCT